MVCGKREVQSVGACVTSSQTANPSALRAPAESKCQRSQGGVGRPMSLASCATAHSSDPLPSLQPIPTPSNNGQPQVLQCFLEAERRQSLTETEAACFCVDATNRLKYILNMKTPTLVNLEFWNLNLSWRADLRDYDQ